MPAVQNQGVWAACAMSRVWDAADPEHALGEELSSFVPVAEFRGGDLGGGEDGDSEEGQGGRGKV